MGGAGLGGYSYYQTGQQKKRNGDPRFSPDERVIAALTNGFFGAMAGHAIGDTVGFMRAPRPSYTQSPPPGGYSAGSEYAKSNRPPPSSFNFSSADPSRHGSMGKVWQTVQNSPEMKTDAARHAANEFMKHVGTKGVSVEDLKKHMDHFSQDTATGQMMGVLFNKHYGAKTAGLEEAFLGKFAALQTFGIW